MLDIEDANNILNQVKNVNHGVLKVHTRIHWVAYQIMGQMAVTIIAETLVVGVVGLQFGVIL